LDEDLDCIEFAHPVDHQLATLSSPRSSGVNGLKMMMPTTSGSAAVRSCVRRSHARR
jgi:hypothetical protein